MRDLTIIVLVCLLLQGAPLEPGADLPRPVCGSPRPAQSFLVPGSTMFTHHKEILTVFNGSVPLAPSGLLVGA